MIPGIEWVLGVIHVRRLRRRFPQSVIYYGAGADRESLLGTHTVLFSGARLTASILGSYSYVQANAIVNHADIGPFCSIAGGVIIGLGEHPLHMVSTNPIFYDPRQPLPKFFVKEELLRDSHPITVIGADVWIGQGAMLKSGVHIGVGAVIGAGSMVTKDIPPYTVAAGNPCRPIRSRFSEDICLKLLQSEWWTWQESDLIKMAPFFGDPGKFLDAMAGREEPRVSTHRS